MAAAARVTAALRLGEEDQNTIVTLRKELEKTWKQISASHSRVRAFVGPVLNSSNLHQKDP